MKKDKVLLLEDDPTLGYILKEYLEMKNFSVTWFKTGKKVLETFGKGSFDICVLDVMLPDLDGFSVAQGIQLKDSQVPIIFLTAKSLKVDKLKGFNLGADDYICKPVDEEELVARLKAVLRRRRFPLADPDFELFKLGTYLFDFNNQKLKNNEGDERILTEKEALLLKQLCQFKGRLLSRKMVLKTIWNQSDYFTRRSMDVFISRLRKYLSKDPRIQIENVYGSGFILKIAEDTTGIQ